MEASLAGDNERKKLIELLTKKCETTEDQLKTSIEVFIQFKQAQELLASDALSRNKEGEGASKEQELQSSLLSLKQLQLLHETRSEK